MQGSSGALRVDVYLLVESVCSGLRGVMPLLLCLFLFLPLPFLFFLSSFLGCNSVARETATEFVTKVYGIILQVSESSMYSLNKKIVQKDQFDVTF